MKGYKAFDKDLKCPIFLDCRYLVSKTGDIYSLFGTHGKRSNPKIIKPVLCGGYKKITLTLDNKKRLKTSLHRVIAFSFDSGKKFSDKDLVVNHIDGNKLNNSIKNLEIVTRRENSVRASVNGFYNKNCVFKFNNKQKLSITNLPNFNKKIFFEITGIQI